MDEQQLLSRLRHGDEQALTAVITRFSAYVVTVIHNRSRGLLSPEDEDELASSVFFALWQSCRAVKAGSIRAWLGSVARNKTIDRMRRTRMDMPLDEELAGTDDFLLEETVKKEQARQLREAVAQLSEPDREIIRRFYDLCQDRAGNCCRAGADACSGAHAAGTQPGSHQKRVMPGRVCI